MFVGGCGMANSISDTKCDELKALRQGLLHLHKMLLDLERVGYERSVDASETVMNFYSSCSRSMVRLVARLSELIVQTTRAWIRVTRTSSYRRGELLCCSCETLLSPAEEGPVSKNYFALQQSPDVVLLHAEIMRVLGRGKY